MSWEDRDYADDREKMGRPGGDWRGLRPTFDNPFSWALSLGRISGILIRVHLLFLVFIVIELLRATQPSHGGSQNFVLTAISMGCLFVIVLAHEFGHCLACRWKGGEADEILMWPLGGLAYCRPPQHWVAHLVTAAGGPMVNVILCVVAGVTLGLVTGRWLGVALPNPITIDGLWEYEVGKSKAHQALFLFNWISLVLLLFNLLPIFPLDGGRILQAALWPKVGYHRSMVFAVRAGFVGGIGLVIFGAVTSQWMIVGIALFGIITCYMTMKQLQWTDAMLGIESDEYALSVHDQVEHEGERKSGWRERRAERQAQREQEEAREVDRILEKIAQSGIESLTRNEKSLLRRVTERKRQGS